MKIGFSFIESKEKGIKKELIYLIARSIEKYENRRFRNIDIVLTSDSYLRHINKNFLNHDYFTDVITFPEYFKECIDGNIFISLERVKSNSSLYSGGDFGKEFYRVIIHGFLHLVGFKDNTEDEKYRMTRRENFYLKELNLLSD